MAIFFIFKLQLGFLIKDTVSSVLTVLSQVNNYFAHFK